jgi:hypothetical protein
MIHAVKSKNRLEPIAEIGFWCQIPSPPCKKSGFDGTGEAPIPPKKAAAKRHFRDGF